MAFANVFLSGFQIMAFLEKEEGWVKLPQQLEKKKATQTMIPASFGNNHPSRPCTAYHTTASSEIGDATIFLY